MGYRKKATEISFHGKKLLLYRGTQQAQLKLWYHYWIENQKP